MYQDGIGAPFERITIDIVGPFPNSRSEHCYLQAIMDYFSEWSEGIAIF